jgi:hypothetical protein
MNWPENSVMHSRGVPRQFDSQEQSFARPEKNSSSALV